MRRVTLYTYLTMLFCCYLVGLPTNSQAAPDYWDPDFTTLGIVYQEASVSPGARYWRLVEAYADDPDEGGGKINIFYKTKDTSGSFIGGVWVRNQFGTSHVDTQTKNPPDWGDFPQSGGNWCPADPPGPYTTFVLGRSQSSPDPSDRVVGMGLPCNYHWSYRLIFEETFAESVDTPTPTLTPTFTRTPGPSATPTPPPTIGPGEPAWKLSYARQYGQYVTGGVAGQVELFATDEDGVFQRAGMTNDANLNTAVFGYTQPASDPFTPGNLRIAFDINNSVYDFHVYDPPTKSDRSPDCHWLEGLPHYGHYKWEFWFRHVANESAYEFYPYEPVYHYDLVNGFNSSSQEAPNYASDAFSLTEWAGEQWQTFVVPNNVNRIISAKAFAVRQEGAKFRMVFSIHEGGPSGSQVGPSVTSREKSSNEFANVKVDWGMEDVPVTPGGTYALRVAASDGGGFNMYGTDNNNYSPGMLYNGATASPGRDMVAVIAGAKAIEVTPTPTPSASPTPTATQGSGFQPGPVYGFLGLFDFAQRWQDRVNETSTFETAYDFVVNGAIDEDDLLTIFDTWHRSPPTPEATATPTLSPTVTPTATQTATPGPTVPPGNVVYQVDFEDFTPVNWGTGLDFDLPVYTQNYWMWPLHDGGDWANLDFAISTDSRSGKSVQFQLKNGNGIRGCGLEMLFANDRPLVPNKMHTVTVWAKSDFSDPQNEFSDLVLAREPGSCGCSIIQEYGGNWRVRATNVAGWQRLSISFRSNSDTTVGDKVVIMFAGDSPKSLFGAVFDELVVTQTEE